MAGERRVVDEDDVIAELAVMGDMGADHQEAMGADAGHQAAAFGAGIDGDVLADDGLRPNLEAALFAVIFLVLRERGRSRRRGRPRSLRRACVRPVTTACEWRTTPSPSFDVGADHAKRADLDPRRQLGVRIDHGGRMNSWPCCGL